LTNKHIKTLRAYNKDGVFSLCGRNLCRCMTQNIYVMERCL